ncbi:MAG: M1 family metallopeptidase [Planctomycetota bacterium]
MNARPSGPLQPRLVLLCLPLLWAASCNQTPPEPESGSPETGPGGENPAVVAVDTHSFAEPERVRVRHVSLDLEADFEQRIVRGSVRLDVDRTDRSAPLTLDVGDGITVSAVEGADQTAREFSIGDPVEHLGRPLRIQLADSDESVTVRYEANVEAAAVQWLEPSQTEGGRQPFLYTQGQSIFTRTWIPLQDSPGVRVTYDATIRCPEDLVAVMSADVRIVKRPGVTEFRLTKPIPPYLIALAIGDLAKRELSERCAVWAEPSLVEAAANEFEDMPSMLAISESLFGPYRWGRYDVLVLPPAFPFGGMENPCLTFATPTILAGDKSLVALIAHELAHSWSGNLVTNATWRDFWLNEGFTVYCEQRIVEALFGPERAAMEIRNGLTDLAHDLADLEEQDEILHIDLSGRHPDDGFSSIPYDKGAALLRRIEEIVGRERFDEYLTKWFSQHEFVSVDTETFVSFLRAELPEAAEAVDLETWINAPGLPSDAPSPASDALDRIDAMRTAFLSSGDATQLDRSSWTTMETLRFLRGLPDGTDPARLDDLDQRLEFTASTNAEILAAWLERRVHNNQDELPVTIRETLEAFLLRVGRRKFLTPLYEAYFHSDADAARALYERARPRYHAVSRGTLDALLDWSSDD